MSDYLKRANLARQYFSNFIDKPFRPQQEEGLEFLGESRSKYVMFNMPTGSGKSLMGLTIGKMNTSVTYLCSTKMLQDQLEKDFPEAKLMKGRNNYPCLLHEELFADNCTHSKFRPCRFIKQCPYRLQKEAVLKHPIRILNYSYYLHEVNTAGRFSCPNIIVCDEADMLENILIGYISLNISKGMIDRYGLGEPKLKTSTAKEGVVEWGKWVKKAQGKLMWRFQLIERELNSAIDDQNSSQIESHTKQKNRIARHISSMTTMVDLLDDTWMWTRNDNNWEFRPIWLTNKMTEKFFFGHSDKFVLMSATLPPPIVSSKLFGLDIDDIDYIEMDSAFPPENRPIIIKPVYNLTRDTFDSQIPIVKEEIKKILDAHPNEKGIIHAVSYKLANVIMEIGDTRLGTHNSSNREEIIQKFIKSSKPLVLVSPAITRGLDLPDELCKWILFAKAPFLSLGDKVTQARTYSGKFGSLWYANSCAEALIQGAGRGVRHETDTCTTYILDLQAKNLITRNTGLFPRWVKNAMRFE